MQPVKDCVKHRRVLPEGKKEKSHVVFRALKGRAQKEVTYQPPSS